MIFTPYEQFQGLLKVGDYHKAYVHMTSNPKIIEEMTKEEMEDLLYGNPKDADLIKDFVQNQNFENKKLKNLESFFNSKEAVKQLDEKLKRLEGEDIHKL